MGAWSLHPWTTMEVPWHALSRRTRLGGLMRPSWGHLCFCALFLWRLHTSVLEDETRKSSSPLGLLISTNHASFLQQHRRPHPTHILLHRPETTWKYQGHSYKCQAWFSSAYSGIFLRLMKMVMWRHKFCLLQVDIDKKKRLGVALSEEFGSCMFCLLW